MRSPRVSVSCEGAPSKLILYLSLSHGLADFVDVARKDVMGAVDEGDVVAKSLHALHVVGGEYDGGAEFFVQPQYLFSQEVGVYGVEAGERLIENQ